MSPNISEAKREAITALVSRLVLKTEVYDIHTHLYDPAFGELLLYGQDYFGIDIPKDTIKGKKLLKKAHDKGSKTAELIYCSSLTEDQQKTCKL